MHPCTGLAVLLCSAKVGAHVKLTVAGSTRARSKVDVCASDLMQSLTWNVLPDTISWRWRLDSALEQPFAVYSGSLVLIDSPVLAADYVNSAVA